MDLVFGSASRSEFHKLSSLETLRRLRTDEPAAEQPPADLDIDTDHTDPDRSAASIAARFGLTPQPILDRYPDG